MAFAAACVNYVRREMAAKPRVAEPDAKEKQ
jgi:hypothetical protein